jgi:hypothetical protein
MDHEDSNSLWAHEERALLKALNKNHTQTLAANELDIDRSTLANKIVGHKIVRVYMTADDWRKFGQSGPSSAST